MLQQSATDQRPDRRPCGTDGAPQAQRHGPFLFILEGPADDPQHTRHDHRPAQGEQDPSTNEHGWRLGKGSQQGRNAEYQQPAQQDAPIANAIGQGPHRHQQSGHQQRVDIDNPEDFGA